MKISVGMTTYNSSKYLREQLDSVLNQTMMPDEIVVFDDASTDNTVDVLREYIDKLPLRIFVNEKNVGYMKNFSKCFQECTGDIIISCDADDVWFKDKVEEIVRCFEKTGAVYVYHDAIVVDGEMNVTQKSLNASWDNTNNKEDKETILLRSIKRQGFPYGMTMAFKRFMLDKISPFMFAHDEWIYMCAPFFGEVRCIDKPLTYYRRHGNNTSGSNGESIIKKVLSTGVNKWFDWPEGYVKSYGTYFRMFENKFPESIRMELSNQIVFREKLVKVVNAKNKFMAIKILYSIYGESYKKYRGHWKMFLLDILNVISH